MIELRAHHEFFPVGQGLFSFGSVVLKQPKPIAKPKPGVRPVKTPRSAQRTVEYAYRWVYDCGSSTAKRLVSNAIGEVKSRCRDDRLDLLTISHFHNDHINGVVEILKRVGAKTVMLPWAPLWHRLAIGYAQGLQAGDAEFRFFVDPVAYLIEEAGDGFDRVLFVMPSEDEGPPFDPDLTMPELPPEGPDDTEKDEGPGEWVSGAELEVGNAPWKVKTLRPGQSVPALLGAWEFIPYNDPTTRPADPEGFATIVDGYRDILMHGNEVQRTAALRDLRNHYDEIFGRAAMNDVSLFLYGGAVGHWAGQSSYSCDCMFHRLVGFCGCWKQNEKRGAILLAGDGNLNSPQRWDTLSRYLDQRRARHACIMQVPHHGARANWHEGLAGLAAPGTSVFSSDPRHSYGHPHAEVLRDFWPFRPVQVDQHAGFATSIFLEK